MNRHERRAAKAAGKKEYYTAAELAALKLPGLPETDEEIEVFMMRRVLSEPDNGLSPQIEAEMRADLASAEEKIRRH